MTRSIEMILNDLTRARLVRASLLARTCLLTAAFAVSACITATAQDTTATPSDETVVSNPDPDEPEEPPYTPKSKQELQRALSAIQYKVTQMEETEPAFRNKYWDNKKTGVYRCIICGQSLFASDTKYKSGTGWPSFYAPIKKDHVGYKSDFHLFYPRQEVHCSRCKAHLGHVFNDGPKNKTGKRYCMNSAALRFESETEKKRSPSETKSKSPTSASSSSN